MLLPDFIWHRLKFRIIAVFISSTLILCSVPTSVHAQNGHYWTQHYGTKSMLLSGSVIGGVDDLGAVFYNPSRLTSIESPAFIISADVYQISNLKLEDTFGDKFNSKSSDIGSVPSLTAGTFKIPFMKKHYFGWAILSRHNDDFGFSFRNDREAEDFPGLPGAVDLNYNFDISNRLNEQWTGFAWAHEPVKGLSVGASVFLSRVKMSKSNSIDLQVLSDLNDLIIYRYDRSTSFSQYGIVLKLGASQRLGNNSVIGLTVLTPTIQVTGDGSYRYEEFYNGLDSAGTTPDLYTVDVQDDLNIEYNTPWAVGIGYTIPWKRNMIHFSAEWFSAVAGYNIMEAGDHISQSNGDTISFTLKDELNSVINYGIGLELYINEKVSGFLSFSTDNSAATGNLSNIISNSEELTISNIKSPYYHFGGGVVLSLLGADITVGTTYTGASQTYTSSLALPFVDDDYDFLEDSNESKLSWSRWRFIFSFSLPFLEKKLKDIEDKFGI
jgi:hypothetical protein